jgi:cardiolipin synthase
MPEERRDANSVSSDVLTVPNVLSALRLVGVPVFLWAILQEYDALALVLLAASGITDWLDGKIARRYGLVSRLGELLDPVADRLYIASTLFGLAWREIVPWWLVAVLLAREVFMAVVVLVAKRHGWLGLPVHFAGKAATFNLLYAFPLLLLGDGDGTAARIAEPIAWGFAWWGVVLYWLSGVLYAVQLRRLLSTDRAVPA